MICCDRNIFVNPAVSPPSRHNFLGNIMYCEPGSAILRILNVPDLESYPPPL